MVGEEWKRGVVGWQLKSLEDVRCKEEEKKAEEDEEKERQWSLKPERLRRRGNRERMEWEFCKILRVWEDINLGNVFFFFFRLRVSTDSDSLNSTSASRINLGYFFLDKHTAHGNLNLGFFYFFSE